MRAAVEKAYGPWDDAWQRDYFRRRFDPANLRVIQLQDQDVGVLFVQARSEELFLAEIEILPEFQRKGIGAAVMRDLMDEARRQGKPVALQVLKGNVDARRFYERLGFKVTGEKKEHYVMAWEP